ncbi:hypothetical protein Moror_9456 [Moniliophthora roreri MCA 2997]|nr:hypothetical protein Moror_9456 [Moniliophthora roreri MCA 2997]
MPDDDASAHILELLSLDGLRNLRRLSINIEGYDSVDDEVLEGLKQWTDAMLIQMVSSRRQGGVAGGFSDLEQLTLVGAVDTKGNPIQDSTSVADMRQLCEEGLVYRWHRWTWHPYGNGLAP